MNNITTCEYVVIVDYKMTVEGMVAAGRYDKKDSNISSWTFPISGTGTIKNTLKLINFTRPWCTDEIEDYLDAYGLRPAMLAELLAFGATYPDVQREFPIVALGTVWVDCDGGRSVPILDGNEGKRELLFSLRVYRWSEICRFLAVRK